MRGVSWPTYFLACLYDWVLSHIERLPSELRKGKYLVIHLTLVMKYTQNYLSYVRWLF